MQNAILTNEHMTINHSHLVLEMDYDGNPRVKGKFIDGNVWLSVRDMTLLYGRSMRTIQEHIQNLTNDGTINPSTQTVLMATQTGNNKGIKHYNLEAILSVGYNIKSKKAAMFRQWATTHLTSILKTGVSVDEITLSGNVDLYLEASNRIANIRVTEAAIWRKLRDIYATATDYDPSQLKTRSFIANIQNKIHYAAHGHTAIELILSRIDHAKPNVGMTTSLHSKFGKADLKVAKNYMFESELKRMDEIVQYLLAGCELINKTKPKLTLDGWTEKITELLHIGEQSIAYSKTPLSQMALNNAVSREYSKYSMLKKYGEVLDSDHGDMTFIMELGSFRAMTYGYLKSVISLDIPNLTDIELMVEEATWEILEIGFDYFTFDHDAHFDAVMTVMSQNEVISRYDEVTSFNRVIFHLTYAVIDAVHEMVSKMLPKLPSPNFKIHVHAIDKHDIFLMVELDDVEHHKQLPTEPN